MGYHCQTAHPIRSTNRVDCVVVAKQRDVNLNAGARTLTEREICQIEGWARQTRLAEMLSFFENLPRYLFLPRPVLLGSNNEWEILAEGFVPRRQVIGAIPHLDEPFNPTLILQKTLMAEKRQKSLGV